MKKLITTATILICFIANSQCIKGDCVDGTGKIKYDLKNGTKGIYEGGFKDRNPDGKGKYVYENFQKLDHILDHILKKDLLFASLEDV